MLILLTNDDGIHSEGLMTLRDNLLKRHEVYVVAPERERTCVGHAITLHNGNIFSTNGTPADCVFLAVRILLEKKPDFIISGLNTGPNMGQDVNYSGTVAAAKEGAFLDVPSMAVSISARNEFLFHEATQVIEKIIEIVSTNPFLHDTFLNVNIPNMPYKDMKGFMVTRLGKRIYNDTVIERVDPRGGKYYWIGGNGENYELIDGTDFYAIEKGYVSITPLDLDMTSSHSINNYKKYFRGPL
ncbi:MAG: 5'/3'-nucleotidase SurE [Proteobacteria bacterium]|nr:5'/3'-nucleotidase SurE [Pseudomonadota bacterium]